MYADEEFGIELDATLYALDSTIIDLCLTSFPWSRLNQYRGGVKLHTLLNLRGNIPDFIRISGGTVSDYYGMDSLILEPGAFYVFDRGYYSFARLFLINKAPAFFVIRAMKKLSVWHTKRHLVEIGNWVISDHTVKFKTKQQLEKYPEPLRYIEYFDPKTRKTLVFLTNNFELSALEISMLYKNRWFIELFFKWIKQHLKIKSFWGRSENAVKTQIWIAISTYVLVAIMKKRLKTDLTLYTILQILSISLFEKKPIYQVLTERDYKKQITSSHIQLKLFES